MRKLWLCLFYTLCAFTLSFSLFWMAAPTLPLPEASSGSESAVSLAELPARLAQALPGGTAPAYYLCDRSGRVAVYRCDAAGQPAGLVEVTEIYVNLLPEPDALRLKQGFTVQSDQELATLLEDLGG